MIRLIARMLSERMKIKIIMGFLVQMAYVKPGQTVKFKLTVKEGKTKGVMINRLDDDSWYGEFKMKEGE